MLSMTWEEFQKDCGNFMHLSKTFEDGWEVMSVGSDVGQNYLKITEKVEEDINTTNEEEESLLEEQLELLKNGTKQSKELITVEYHVVYSVSYQVPMLFFRGYRSSKYIYITKEI